MHATGRGTPKDKEESVKWFRAAADQGLAMAQFNLAQRYQFGQGTATNLTEAYKWFMLAAREGIPDAAREGAAIKGSLTPEQLAEAERGVAGFTVKKLEQRPGKPGRKVGQASRPPRSGNDPTFGAFAVGQARRPPYLDLHGLAEPAGRCAQNWSYSPWPRQP
jgi:TPR repeat protein